VDGPGMGGTLSQRFEVWFASSADVGVVDESKGDKFDRVNLDLPVSHAVATTSSDLRPPPQPERHRYVTRQHVRTQFPAELHGLTLGEPAVERATQAGLQV
jgi:hypothetical protein